MKVSQLLQERYTWNRPPENQFALALALGYTSPERMAEKFRCTVEDAVLALEEAQAYLRDVAREFFDEVTELAEETGESYAWNYQVWLPVVSECVHQLMIVGETGSGKSFLAKVVLRSRAAHGKVVVLDPHAIQPSERSLGDWGVCSVGAGRRYGEISSYMEQLLQEMTRRYDQRSEGITTFEYLTVFIDEWPSIKAHCDNAANFMKTVAREGRKVGMRLVILSQSDQVESLGLKGEGDTKKNFSFLYLGEYAEKLLPRSLQHQERVGYFSFRGRGYPISTDGLGHFIERFSDLNKLRIVPSVWSIA